MKMDRRVFTKGLAAALALPSWTTKASAAKLPVNRVTKIRCYYPPNYQSNGPQAFPQSNMVVLVDTEAGITGIGQGGSPDTVRNMARSVIGKNAFDTEFIWQHGFMDGFYSPGKERLHALGAIDLALWDIKGKALEHPSLRIVRRQGAPAHRTLRDKRRTAGAGPAKRSAANESKGTRRRDDGGGVPRVSGWTARLRPSPAGGPAVDRPAGGRGGAGRGAASPDAPVGAGRPRHFQLALAHPRNRRSGGTDSRRHRAGRRLDDRPSPELRLSRIGRGL